MFCCILLSCPLILPIFLRVFNWHYGSANVCMPIELIHKTDDVTKEKQNKTVCIFDSRVSLIFISTS